MEGINNLFNFNSLYDILYSDKNVIRAMRDKKFSELLDRIEEYMILAKEQYVMGNHKRALRMYLIISKIVDLYFECDNNAS